MWVSLRLCILIVQFPSQLNPYHIAIARCTLPLNRSFRFALCWLLLHQNMHKFKQWTFNRTRIPITSKLSACGFHGYNMKQTNPWNENAGKKFQNVYSFMIICYAVFILYICVRVCVCVHVFVGKIIKCNFEISALIIL